MWSFILFGWTVLQVLAGYNLVLPLVLFVLYKCIPRKPLSLQPGSDPDYAIIVTAYEQTDSIPSVVASILQSSYTRYLVYVVADKCDTSGLSFSDERVVLLRPEKTLASNTRSHFYAIRHFRRLHTHLTIIDSDNIVTPDYLSELNRYFKAGFSAVQGERKAKNLDTTYACLDAARDIYYHFYDGKLLFGIGSSATLAGSGMAFTVALYRECLEALDVSGAGFDKVLQKEIISRGYRIAFNELAIVYDEKTSRADQLVKQRARWINTWFRYFSFGFGLLSRSLTKANWNQFAFSVILLRPPLFLFLLASIACFTVNLLLGDVAAVMLWMAAFLCFILAFAIALVQSGTDRRIYRSLWNIPVFVFYQVLSLAKVRQANRYSVATQHYHKDQGEASGPK
ncbi:glycosyltransferase [Sediminibacterium soli]|uniref:glycosyltransferase n=1 Tax=Sediminibacterium soli TaxID=2698829 RepID=UPI00137B5BC7|nr:glycosyltransferase [Sediminibacterium soli]NCI45551.1 glycosyltransferase family 2 protein [Sediminibacterium soli]